MKKKITKFLVSALLFLTLMPGQNLDAAYYYPNAYRDINGYFFGAHVVNFRLHASGYAYDGRGQVASHWSTSRASWPVSMYGQRTWTRSDLRGEYAMGGFDYTLGARSAWGIVGLSNGTQVTSILFSK